MRSPHVCRSDWLCGGQGWGQTRSSSDPHPPVCVPSREPPCPAPWSHLQPPGTRPWPVLTPACSQSGRRCPPPCHVRKPRLRWGHSEGARVPTLEPPGCPQTPGPGVPCPVEEWAWLCATHSLPAPPLLTTCTWTLESSFCLQTSPPQSPCRGSPRAAADPRAPWPGSAPRSADYACAGHLSTGTRRSVLPGLAGRLHKVGHRSAVHSWCPLL